FEESAGGNVQIERLTLPAEAALPCRGYPEERLYYVLGGFGAMSVYGKMGQGDTYVLRQNVTLYFTPGLMHEIVNTGEMPMTLLVFRVRGGLVPEGAEEGVQKWTSIGRSKAVGTGFWYTDVFNLQENETAREGQHLQVWGVGLRRSQKLVGGEVLLLGDGSSTRRHAHSETDETFYILMGEGVFVNDAKRIPCRAGSVCSVPVGLVHHVENTGDTPMLYICITSFRE
ncbi:MAG: cupin domain-containing protein, partial [Clostridia bacterium]|nr:cupin domain-containing protein [Clostridia bacterium]